MLDKNCPVCKSPIFRLKNGGIWCANCDKRVIVVAEGEREGSVLKPLLWEEVEDTLLLKLKEVNMKLKVEEDPDEIYQLVRLLSSMLESFEKLRGVKQKQ